MRTMTKMTARAIVAALKLPAFVMICVTVRVCGGFVGAGVVGLHPPPLATPLGHRMQPVYWLGTPLAALQAYAFPLAS
jgi:hypothetical protein